MSGGSFSRRFWLFVAPHGAENLHPSKSRLTGADEFSSGQEKEIRTWMVF
ncbi:hypothetical protein EL18_01144 [Nitratireductor basaltis]|uniref:Uncharacterized protein n=1 Tax=Nitratireductor basaltis TaxID=472175 RepID=A0A084UAX8_9HYPH|nr:hypothetical protein EL18_01144 [Nitratireductor basaltis]